MLRRITKILSQLVLVLLLLLATLWVVIQFSPVQTWLVKQAARQLSRDLGAEVQVQRVDFSLFKKVLLEGVLVRDQQKDTLAYIGRAGVRMNNWFFLKNKAVIYELTLEDLYARLHRTDSVWNYQFIVDYFAAPSTGKKKTSAFEVQLRKLRFDRIRILQRDEWAGQDLEGNLRSLVLDANRISLQEQRIDINRILVNAPSFAISNYEGRKPPRKGMDENLFHRVNDTIPPEPFLPGWQVLAGSLLINDGVFTNDIRTVRPPYPYFDGEHIRFYDINAGFGNIALSGDSLRAKINLSLREQSGLEVTRLNANFNWHGRGMEFHELLLETPRSRLGNFFALRYNNFNHDMSRFINHVRMEGHFEKSRLHSDDIAFFAPELKDWDDVIELSGNARGTLDHLKGDNIVVTTGKNTRLEGKFTMDGLPDINTTFLDINAASFTTNYSDAALVYPDLRKIKFPAIQKISRLNFSGSFTGYLNDFVTYGTIRTNLGTIVSDINLKLPARADPIYSGKIKTTDFQLGSFLNEPLLGSIDMEGYLRGKGFTTRSLFAEVDGKIRQVEINGYTYRNIEARGIAERKKFDGSLVVNDEHLALNLTGLLDASEDTVVYKLNGMITRLEPRELNLWKKNISFSGMVDFNFRVRRIEDFMGTARISEARLLYNEELLSFDSLFVSNVFIDPENKKLELRSNEFDASLIGDYNIVQLPNLALLYLSNYFPSYIRKPTATVNQQRFDFRLETRDITQFLQLFDVPLRGFDQSEVMGNFDIAENTFNINASVPFFEYNNILFEEVTLNGRSNLSRLYLNGGIREIRLNDSLSLPNTSFTASAQSDTGRVTIRTSASQTLKDANLNARFHTATNGVTITFEPSTLVLSEKTWRIEKEGDFFFGNDNIYSSGIRFSSGVEEIYAYTQPSDLGNKNDLIVELRRVQLGDVMPYLLPDPRLEGSVTGRVDIMNPLGKMQVDARITADKFRFNNDSIGVVTIRGNYNSNSGVINYSAESDNLNHVFSITGNTNILDPANITTDNVLVLKNESLTVLNPYLSVILTGIRGTGNGIIRVTGKGNRPQLIGSVRLNNTSFVLDYTRCRYWLENGTVIQFREGAIDFGSMKLRDTLNRSATFSGILNHQFFNEMSFNLRFRTDDDRKGMLVLNTTKRDNDLFYGSVVARASGSITGPANDIQLRLQGEPTDSSRLHLLTSDTKVTGTADFIVFRKYGSELQVQTEIKETSNITVDLDVTANPYAKIFLIFDELTNDVIEGQGTGSINLRVGTSERTTMTGNFEITNGRYNFNWQKLISKPFLINNGTINWSGDPYDARINIDAKVLVERVALLPELTNGCSDARNDIIVVANMSNTLKNPEIKFRFELPPSHPCRNNPLTMSGFNQLYNNPDELNRQVISLLLIGSFISGTAQPGITSGNIGSTLITNVAGTLSEFIAQQVTTGLDAVLKNIPGIKDLELDPYITFTPGLISGTQAQGMGFQGTGTFGFTRRLLNGRILLKAGGSVLVGAGQMATVQNNNQLTPDLAIEWLITPDGKLRLIGFYRTVFDIQRRNDRTGVSFSYVREFNKLW